MIQCKNSPVFAGSSNEPFDWRQARTSQGKSDLAIGESKAILRRRLSKERTALDDDDRQRMDANLAE